ncbi:MAG: hypothetical protein KC733_00325, partial [Candidatus Omnitrophica bacterium]|nr:hypothetical protein [Candidatus Omnitrophota bacterium]
MLTYWTIGGNINAFLSDTTRREKYGKNLLLRLGQEISIDQRTLYQAAQFHRVYPRVNLSLPLNWSHYRYLSRLPNESQRRYWERRIIREHLSVKDLLGLLTSQENGASAPALSTPSRGLLYHYRVIKRSDLVSGGDVCLVDCGFENYIEPPSSSVRIDNTRIYRSVKNESYTLRAMRVTKEKIYVYKALIERIVDADTLVVIVDCGFGIYHREILRLRFIDAPEKSTTA